MKNNIIQITMVAAAFALMSMAAWGQGKPTNVPPDRAQIIVRDDDGERGRGYDIQLLFRAQINEYNYTDIETGERMSNILQLVTDVNDYGLTYCDANGKYYDAAVNKKSEVILTDKVSRAVPRHRRNDDDIPLSSVLRRGDLVVVEGTFRMTGTMLATRIRLIGTLRGISDDNSVSPSYGYRYYGEITTIDARRSTLTIRQDNRNVNATFSANVQILANGREQSTYYLRKGDRVVAYSFDAANRTAALYRIVVLTANERYPRNNEPFWTDPDTRIGQDKNSSKPTAPLLEGTLLTFSRGYYNSQLDVMSFDGRVNSFMVSAAIPLYDRHGADISLDTLRRGDRLRVFYQPAKGIMEAIRIELY